MKKGLLLFTALIFATCATVQAQSPQGMNYQAVVRNATGQPVVSGTVNFRFTIRTGTATGTSVFQETQSASTNQFGLASVVIGSVGSGLSSVDWANGSKFLQVEIDPTGGTTFTDMGTTQLVSVPYALYAANSAPGPQGPTGPQGAAGNDGATGATGAPGADGSNGTDGADGATGPQGPQGVTGAQGATGSQGPTGAQGATGPAGATGAQGATGPGGATGATGAQGATGANGAQGAQGIVNVLTASASGANPNDLTANTIGFVGPTVSVTITAGQKIHLVATKAMGSTIAGGATGLDIFPGYQLSTATTPTASGNGIYGIQCSQNSRTPYTVNYVFTGLAAGTYTIGMVCRSPTPANWNLNEYGYTSVIVVN